jgi:hypothetical protein
MPAATRNVWPIAMIPMTEACNRMISMLVLLRNASFLLFV